MTDLEMDLVLAKAEIEQLKKTIELLKGKRCNFGVGVTIKPDGVNELDPCIYEDIEIHTNATVVVKRCVNCGHIELEWHRQENTEDMVGGEWNG